VFTIRRYYRRNQIKNETGGTFGPKIPAGKNTSGSLLSVTTKTDLKTTPKPGSGLSSSSAEPCDQWRVLDNVLRHSFP
jgi:hypothetical protein